MSGGTLVSDWEATFQTEWSAYLRKLQDYALVVLRAKGSTLPFEETKNLLGEIVDLLDSQEYQNAVASEVATDIKTRDLIMQEVQIFNKEMPETTQTLSHGFATEKLGQGTTIKDSVQDYIHLDRHPVVKRVLKILNEVISLIRG